MILATLVRIGEQKHQFGTPEMVPAFAELETDLAAIGQPPPTEWEIKALTRAELARLDARIGHESAELAEMDKLGRHARAMGLGPEDRMGVVLDKLGVEPGDPIPEPGPRLVNTADDP